MTQHELEKTLDAIETALDDGLDQLEPEVMKDLGITSESIYEVRRQLSELMSQIKI